MLHSATGHQDLNHQGYSEIFHGMKEAKATFTGQSHMRKDAQLRIRFGSSTNSLRKTKALIQRNPSNVNSRTLPLGQDGKL
jgi:hypothetical protein